MLYEYYFYNTFYTYLIPFWGFVWLLIIFFAIPTVVTCDRQFINKENMHTWLKWDLADGFWVWSPVDVDSHSFMCAC